LFMFSSNDNNTCTWQD